MGVGDLDFLIIGEGDKKTVPLRTVFLSTLDFPSNEGSMMNEGPLPITVY